MQCHAHTLNKVTMMSFLIELCMLKRITAMRQDNWKDFRSKDGLKFCL